MIKKINLGRVVGKDGTIGKDGVSPTVTTKQTDTGAEIEITDVNGKHTVELKNGKDGKDGKDGIQEETDPIYTADKPKIALKSELPTKVSDLANDTGFITSTVDNLANYYKKSETYTKTEVNSLLSNISSLDIEVVQELPTTGDSNKIYLLAQDREAPDIYDEYLYINGAWERIGSTAVDLTNYYTKEQVNALIPTVPTKVSELENDEGYLKEYTETDPIYTADKPNLALKSELPTKVSELENDSEYITGYTETDPTVPSHVKAITQNDINSWNGKSDFSGDYNDLTNKPTIPSTEGLATTEQLTQGLAAKQDILVSGTNIKTINNQSILGEGNITIEGGSGGTGGSGYSETELLDEIKTFTLGGTGGVTINQDISLQDSISTYDELVINIAITNDNVENRHPTEYTLKVSNIVFNSSDNMTWDGSRFTLHILTNNGSYFMGMWFKNSNTLHLYNTYATVSISSGNYIRVNSIKGIKYGGSSGSTTVDTELSSTSENPVQNKVIKAYVDNLVGNVETSLQTINSGSGV